MKRLLLISVILILAIGMILGSCGEPTAEETTTPTQQPTQQPTQTQEPEPSAPTAAPTQIEATEIEKTEAPGPYGTLRVVLNTFSYETFDQTIGESFWGQSI